MADKKYAIYFFDDGLLQRIDEGTYDWYYSCTLDPILIKAGTNNMYVSAAGFTLPIEETSVFDNKNYLKYTLGTYYNATVVNSKTGETYKPQQIYSGGVAHDKRSFRVYAHRTNDDGGYVGDRIMDEGENGSHGTYHKGPKGDGTDDTIEILPNHFLDEDGLSTFPVALVFEMQYVDKDGVSRTHPGDRHLYQFKQGYTIVRSNYVWNMQVNDGQFQATRYAEVEGGDDVENMTGYIPYNAPSFSDGTVRIQIVGESKCLQDRKWDDDFVEPVVTADDAKYVKIDGVSVRDKNGLVQAIKDTTGTSFYCDIAKTTGEQDVYIIPYMGEPGKAGYKEKDFCVKQYGFAFGISNVVVSVYKIPASGGSVYGCTVSYICNGVQVDDEYYAFSSPVSKTSLGVTPQENDKLAGSRDIEIAHTDKYGTFTLKHSVDVYQEKNVITDSDYLPEQYTATISIGKYGNYAEIGATGGWGFVTYGGGSHKAYNLYSSGEHDTTLHTVTGDKTSIAIISNVSKRYSLSDNILSHEVMQGNKTGTAYTESCTVGVYNLSYSDTESVNSAEVSAKNYVTNGNGQGESDIVTPASEKYDDKVYATPSVSLSYGTLSASGADIEPTYSVSQKWTQDGTGYYATLCTEYVWASNVTTYSENYGGGSYPLKQKSGTLDSGYTIQSWRIYSSSGLSVRGVDYGNSQGRVYANSLGTTVTNKNDNAGTVTLSITMNGKSGNATATIKREENKVIDSNYDAKNYTASVLFVEGTNTLSAAGGSVTLSGSASHKAKNKYTSGDCDKERTVTDTVSFGVNATRFYISGNTLYHNSMTNDTTNTDSATVYAYNGNVQGGSKSTGNITNSVTGTEYEKDSNGNVKLYDHIDVDYYYDYSTNKKVSSLVKNSCAIVFKNLYLSVKSRPAYTSGYTESYSENSVESTKEGKAIVVGSSPIELTFDNMTLKVPANTGTSSRSVVVTLTNETYGSKGETFTQP